MPPTETVVALAVVVVALLVVPCLAGLAGWAARGRAADAELALERERTAVLRAALAAEESEADRAARAAEAPLAAERALAGAALEPDARARRLLLARAGAGHAPGPASPGGPTPGPPGGTGGGAAAPPS